MAQSQYLPFAYQAGANIVSQPDYAADTERQFGFVEGEAPSAKFNKVWRQASTVAAAITGFIADRSTVDVVDDGDVDALKTLFADAVSAAASGAVITGVTAGAGLAGGGTSGNITLSLASPVAASDGGTGIASYAEGDLLYASGATTLAKLPKVTGASRVLTNFGSNGNPAWSALTVADLGGTVAVANGGTGATALPIAAGPAGWGLTSTLLLAQGTNPVISHGTATSTVGTWGDGSLALVMSSSTSAGTAPYLSFLRTRGSTMAAPSPVLSGDTLGALYFTGWAVGGMNLARAACYAVTTEDWTPTAQGSQLLFQTTAPGTTTISSALIVASNLITLNTAAQITMNGGVALQAVTPNATDCKITLQSGVTGTWQINSQGATSPGEFWIYDSRQSVLRIGIATDGTCRNKTGTWTAISDERVKRDVTEYEHGLSEILQLQPVRFFFNGEGGIPDDDTEQIGLIAQEVEPYLPELVGERPFARINPDSGLPIEAETIFKTVDPGKLVYALVNCVKQLAAEIDNLKAGAADAH